MSSTHLAPHDEVSILGVLVISLGSQTVAFPLDDVIEVLPAMAVGPLPSAPAVVIGMINLRGAPLPVLDLRIRLGLPRREADPDDHVVVCRVGESHIGIWVDQAARVHSLGTDDMVAIEKTIPGPHVSGAVMLPDGMLLVYDVDSFLGTEEAMRLDEAMADCVGGV